MPRLVGQQRRTSETVTLSALAIAAAVVAFALEWFGVVNLIPQFGMR